MDINIHRADTSHDGVLIYAFHPQDLPLDSTGSQVYHCQDILIGKRPSEKIQVVHVKSKLRLPLCLHICKHPLRKHAHRSYLSFLHIFPGLAEIIIADDLAELRRIKLRNEISGKRGIVVIHHPNREFGRHPVLQQSQVEDAAECHHHHRTDQIYGTAPPYSQFTPYYSDYTFHTAMNYLTTIALIPGSRPSTAESGTALTSNVFASYMSVSLVAFHVAYESRTAI